jgi:hypothetical protein
MAVTHLCCSPVRVEVFLIDDRVPKWSQGPAKLYRGSVVLRGWAILFPIHTSGQRDELDCARVNVPCCCPAAAAIYSGKIADI